MNATALNTLLRETPVWVTGMGAVSAAGDSVAKLWEAAIAGRSAAAWHEFPEVPGGPRFLTCRVPGLHADHPSLLPARKLDRTVQLAWLAADAAWRQSGLDIHPERTGIVAGTSRGPLDKFLEAVASVQRGRVAPSLAVSGTLASISGALAQRFEMQGPSATLSATCASGALAIANAAEQILLGKADAMLAGGTEACLHPVVLAQLAAAGILGSHADPHQACRPFDRTRNGLVPGEGSAFLMLESAHTAAARGARPLALLRGWAVGVDPAGRAGVGAEGETLARMTRLALGAAGISPEQVDYINAHGTGTVLNDRAEARAVQRLLGTRAVDTPCSSTKPVTGHCLGATPALEAVLCIEALGRQLVPPTANCHQPDPECAIQMQPLVAHPRRLRTVMSNSLGFWGYHASLVFSLAEES